MNVIFLRPWATKGFLLFIIAITSCSTPDGVIPKPTISISSEIQEIHHECIAGSIHGVDSRLYNVAVYANIDAGWYNLPDRVDILTSISEDGSWNCTTNFETVDEVSELKIFLIPKGYIPPVLVGEQIIPTKMSLVAASKTTVRLHDL